MTKIALPGLFGLAALACAGCTPRPDRQAYLAALVGQPEAAVVRQLGVPSRSYEAGGHTFMAYVERRPNFISSGPFFGVGGGFGYVGGGYGFGGFTEVIERGCETTIEIASGRVLGWALRGNACG